MTITIDATSESVNQDFIQEHTHNGGSSPVGIIVLITQGTANFDTVDTVTYGGDALTRIQTNSNAIGNDKGRTYIYFLGSGVKTGDQTISVDRGSWELTCQVVGVTVDGNYHTTVVDNDGIDENPTDPQVTLSFDAECMSFCCVFSGHNDLASITDLSDQTRIHDVDFGTFTGATSRLTTAQTDDDTIGYTMADESGCLSAFAIREIVFMTDPSEMVKDLLDAEWLTANTDSHLPVFLSSEDPEVRSSRNQDIIKVYESRPRTKTRIDHRFDFATYIAAVTLQVDIGFNPAGAVTLQTHSGKVMEEVERIIQAGRSNPDSYWNLLEQDAFTFQHQYRNFARNILNVNCKRIVQQIPGT